jgi:hypothetical protein
MDEDEGLLVVQVSDLEPPSIELDIDRAAGCGDGTLS